MRVVGLPGMEFILGGDTVIVEGLSHSEGYRRLYRASEAYDLANDLESIASWLRTMDERHPGDELVCHVETTSDPG